MTDTTEVAEETVPDEAREALLEVLVAELGDQLIEHHLIPGVDLWIRVAPESLADVAEYLRERQRFRFFDFISVIDWLPSPFGRSLDSAVDSALEIEANGEAESAAATEIVRGYAGGETRFQILSRVYNLTTGLGIHIKSDVPDDTLTVPSWTGVYAGANWHEREAFEMFGINFAGHPGLQKIYLPGDFEGHPMRKDFPLLARLVKPWPGIVDVEPMPAKDEPTATNPDDVTDPSSSDPSSPAPDAVSSDVADETPSDSGDAS